MYQDQPHVFQAMVFLQKISKFALQRMGNWICENTGKDMSLNIVRNFVRIRNENGFPSEPILNPDAILEDGCRALCEKGIWKRDGDKLYKLRNSCSSD